MISMMNDDMSEDKILTIEGATDSWLPQRLRDWGFAAVTTQSMWTAMSALRTQHFNALAIDLESLEDDVLELVLNIRDINNVIPIIVFGQPEDERLRLALQNRSRVHLLTKNDGVNLEDRTNKIVKGA